MYLYNLTISKASGIQVRPSNILANGKNVTTPKELEGHFHERESRLLGNASGQNTCLKIFMVM